MNRSSGPHRDTDPYTRLRHRVLWGLALLLVLWLGWAVLWPAATQRGAQGVASAYIPSAVFFAEDSAGGTAKPQC